MYLGVGWPVLDVDCVSLCEELPDYFPGQPRHFTRLAAVFEGPVSPHPHQHLSFVKLLLPEGKELMLLISVPSVLTEKTVSSSVCEKT